MPSPDSPEKAPSYLLGIASRYLSLHKFIYTSVMVVTVVSQFIWPTEWWFFWPLAIWSMVFFLHVMTIKTIFVDEDWVNERTEKLSENAFDFGHIETIRDQTTKTAYGDAYRGENKTFDTDTKK